MPWLASFGTENYPVMSTLLNIYSINLAGRSVEDVQYELEQLPVLRGHLTSVLLAGLLQVSWLRSPGCSLNSRSILILYKGANRRFFTGFTGFGWTGAPFNFSLIQGIPVPGPWTHPIGQKIKYYWDVLSTPLITLFAIFSSPINQVNQY